MLNIGIKARKKWAEGSKEELERLVALSKLRICICYHLERGSMMRIEKK